MNHKMVDKVNTLYLLYIYTCLDQLTTKLNRNSFDNITDQTSLHADACVCSSTSGYNI